MNRYCDPYNPLRTSNTYLSHRYVQAFTDIVSSIALAHRTVDEHVDIIRKLILVTEEESKFSDSRLFDQEQSIEAMKVANKQWESAIAFLVSAYWVRAEIFEKQGKLKDAVRSHEQLLGYLETKLGEEVGVVM